MFVTVVTWLAIFLLIVFVVMPLAYLLVGVVGWLLIMCAALVYGTAQFIAGKVDHFWRKLAR